MENATDVLLLHFAVFNDFKMAALQNIPVSSASRLMSLDDNCELKVGGNFKWIIELSEKSRNVYRRQSLCSLHHRNTLVIP